MKRLKKLSFDKKQLGIVDVDLVDSIDLCHAHEVKCVPHCIIFQKRERISQFNGFRIEAINSMFTLISKEYQVGTQSKEKSGLCPNKHELEMVEKLDESIYIDGFFYCNSCQRIERVTGGFMIGHCGICDYDICNECYNL